MEAEREAMGEFRYPRSTVGLVIFGVLTAGVVYVTVASVADAVVNRTAIPVIGYLIMGFGLAFSGGFFLWGLFRARNPMLRLSECGMLHRDSWGREVVVNWKHIVELREEFGTGGFGTRWWVAYRAEADGCRQRLVIASVEALDVDYTALRDTVVGRADLTERERRLGWVTWRREE